MQEISLTVPSSLREKLGEEASRDLLGLLERAIRVVGISRDEYREVLSRLDVVETRLDNLERGYEEFRREFAEFRRETNERFDRMNERFDRMNERLEKMNERMLSLMKWTVGTIALFGTIISVLMAVFKFIG